MTKLLAGAAADISPEMMTSWVWAISLGAAVSGQVAAALPEAPAQFAAVRRPQTGEAGDRPVSTCLLRRDLEGRDPSTKSPK